MTAEHDELKAFIQACMREPYFPTWDGSLNNKFTDALRTHLHDAAGVRLTEGDELSLTQIRAHIRRCHQVDDAEGKGFTVFELWLDTCLKVIDRLSTGAAGEEHKCQ